MRTLSHMTSYLPVLLAARPLKQLDGALVALKAIENQKIISPKIWPIWYYLIVAQPLGTANEIDHHVEWIEDRLLESLAIVEVCKSTEDLKFKCVENF